MQSAPLIAQPFSIKASLREGWKLVHGTKLSALATLLPMMFVALIAFFIMSKIQIIFSGYGPHASLLYSLLSALVDAIMFSGFIAGFAMIGVKRARHEAVNFSEGLQYFVKLPKLASIAYLEILGFFVVNNIFILAVTFIMLKLPAFNVTKAALITLLLALAIAFMLKTWVAFSFQLALDKQLSVIAAIGRSIKMASHHYWKLLAIVVILTVINILGACLMGIGLFWTLPFSYNTLGVVYRDLADKAA
ncbi:MAG: hypothetical protein K0Q57_26 [Gammaproteobacteria bacterium]|jgi:hypothetical protein|nr:hypothetical protein [Gammaproteobacteria bacterium]